MIILGGEKVIRALEDDNQSSTEGDAPMTKTQNTFVLPSAKKNIETLWEWLSDGNVGTIGIQGDPLMGKTWTVRQLMDRAVAASLFDICIFVHGASNNYHTQMQIVDQLNLKFDDDTKWVRYWLDTDGKEKIMREKISESLEGKRFLLILDDIPAYELSEIGVPHPRKQDRSSKVLETRWSETGTTPDRVIKLEQLSQDEAWLLLKKMSGCDLLSYDSPEVCEIAQPLLDSCKGVPFDIVILAGMLRGLLPGLSSSSSGDVKWQLLANLRKAYNLLLNSPKASRIQFIWEMLPTKEVKDCFIFSCLHPQYHQFRKKELITCWINSGFLDGFDSMDKAYDHGNMILKNLTDSHLFFRNDDYFMSVQTQLMKEAREHILNKGFDIQLLERLSLAGGSGSNRDGKLPIILQNGNLHSSSSNNGDRHKSTFTKLLYGDEATLPCAIPDVYFEQMPKVQHVVLLHCGIHSLPASISKLNHLTILVIRGCGSLENVDYIRGLQNLRVLSFSGAQNLKDIPNDFFRYMGDLENLDLSNTQLKQLPSSFSNLYNVRFLILGGCSQLETLPSLEKFHQLCLLDLSGASKLSKVPETSKSLQILDLSQTRVDRLPSTSNLIGIQYLILKGCSLIETLPHPYAFPQLKVLDLSGAHAFKEFHGEISGSEHPLQKIDLSSTQIIQLPSLSKCVRLLEVLLRNCSKLETLMSLDKGIEVLDISGANSFKQFEAASLVHGLRELDLSRTRIQKLPMSSEGANLVRLFIRECEFLEELPHLIFPSLQMLSLSGSVNFEKFKDNSLEKLCCLETLDLSETKVARLPNLSACAHLRKIILKRCSNLQTLPELKTLTKLEVLDLSGATTFKQFQDDSLGRKEHFRELILSGTQTVQISIFSGCLNISQLILRDCTKLEVLPPLEHFTRLEVLDLSGATTFRTFQDKSFGNKYGLQIVDLSGTQVKDLPSLSGCANLRQLHLRDCSNIGTLPILKELTKLEVLDLSGDTPFNNFHDKDLENVAVQKLDISGRNVTEFTSLSGCKRVCQLSMRGCSSMDMLSLQGMLNLQKLDLSVSTVVELPSSISYLSNLRVLLLKDCPRLTSLPPLSELTMLEVLDLSGDISFSQFQDESLGNNYALWKLDISNTKITEYSFFSGCSSLSELSLRRCTNLEGINFEDVLNLQKLDVSQSNVEMFPASIIKLRKLNQLLLKGCSKLIALPPLEELPELKVIDISYTSTQILDGISKRTNLRFLGVSLRKFFWDIDSENNKDLIGHPNWDLYGSEDFGEARVHISVSKADIFSIILKNRELWEKCFKRFHFCLCFSTEWANENGIYLEGMDFVFKDIYYQTNHIPQLTEEPDKFFKICGFETLPYGIQQVLNHVEVLYLKKNDFLKRLSHVGAQSVKAMRECWIERCNLMENTFHEEDVEENLALGRCLENLWVSYLPQLKCLFQGVMPSGSFSCLKHIYVDCCPRLVNLFSSHTELKKLETLKIKFCDEIENVFGDMLLGEETLPSLRILVLWKLPNLKCIGEGALPSLRNLRVKGCPKLEKLPLGIRKTSSYLKIKGEKGWWIKLGLEDERTKLRLHFTQI